MKDDASVDIIRKSFELLDTIQEAIEYIGEKTAESELESLLSLFSDIIRGIGQLEISLDHILQEISDPMLEETAHELADALDIVAGSYQIEDIYQAEIDVCSRLEPAFMSWKSALQDILQPHVLN